MENYFELINYFEELLKQNRSLVDVIGDMLLNQFNIFILTFQGIEELDYGKLTFSRSLSGTNLYNHY